MASPQLENGYTRISNELFEHIIKTSIPGRHKDLWWFVVRKTYGYGKKQDWIPLSQFEKGTGIDRSGVCKIIKDLVAWKLLVKKGGIYAINKHYKEWGSGVRATGGSGVEDNLLVACAPHSKETLQKKVLPPIGVIIKKEDMKYYDERNSEEDYYPVINEEGETQEKKTDNMTNVYWSLLKWAEKRRNKKFILIPKQFKAMKTMRIAGIGPKKIMETWKEMENINYYENGFDFASVLNYLDKKNKL